MSKAKQLLLEIKKIGSKKPTNTSDKILLKYFDLDEIEQIKKIADDELGSDNVVEVRPDPKVDYTYAIRVSDKQSSTRCALIRVYDGEVEALDTFDLEDEDMKTLKELKSGDLKFY